MLKKDRFRKVVIFSAIVAGFFCFTYKVSRPVLYVFSNEFHSQPCNLPVLDPFDSSIIKYFWKPEPVECEDFPSIVFVDQNNVLHLNQSVLGFYSIKSQSEVLCSVESIYRDGDDDNINFNLPKAVKLPGKLDSDFNRVTCKSREGKVLFQNSIASITPKTFVDKSVLEESEEQLSVLMLGIDSISRSASVRYLPKTIEVLRKLKFYDFQGMMKNGGNTIPNIMAQLTGLKLFSDKETLGFENNTFDRFSFLWKNFSATNYVTLFAEDYPLIGMFNHHLKGFQDPPTDHYMRPFWLSIKTENRRHIQYHTNSIVKWLEDKGIQLSTSGFCNQNTMKHMVLINYIKRFILHYKSKRKFMFTFLTELSHDVPHFISYADEDLADLFLWLKNEGFLNRTAIVFFSDHGSGYAGIRNSAIGRIEARMPMLYVLLPEHIKQKYPEVNTALQKNTRRLTTHYDVYQTMVDILNKNFRNPSIQIYKEVKRGISLFREIPSSRSCVEAHIPADLCACYKARPINITNNKLIQKLAGAIVEKMNNILRPETNCKILTLHNILSAQKMSQGLSYVNEVEHKPESRYSIRQFFKPKQGQDSYAITVETIPGQGTFDAFVELDTSGRVRGITNIDRTNAYGNQSSCISDRKLKQYCYC